MSKNRITVVHEHGVLSCEGKTCHINGEVSLPEKTFNNLWSYILATNSDDLDKVMTLHTKNGVPYIKASNYVGTVQTEDGHIIEILPKIYKNQNQEEYDVQLCRRVFLQMLKTYRDSSSKTFQNASLNTKSNFPILERYIENYLNEVQYLIEIGIKKNYVDVRENLNFLKGKLLFAQNLVKNNANKAKFYVQYSKYFENIPQNRIIVTTLTKLSKISSDAKNINRCKTLLSLLWNIPLSENIALDLQKSINTNRLFESYNNIISWSRQFLLNKGYTTFSGSNVNISLLFSAERLFEYFVAHLFKRYAKDYRVRSQSSQYFLVDRDDETSKARFSLRPDIVISKYPDEDTVGYDSVIIDTKWKNIDSSMRDKNYLIDIKDMYQLYAYGKKYEQGENYFIDVIPKLVLIYPFTEKFKSNLKPFIYEEIKKNYGLKLMVVPFNLSDEGINGEGYKKQVFNILQEAENIDKKKDYKYKDVNEVHDEYDSREVTKKETSRYLLFGFYNDEDELNNIVSKGYYSIPIEKFSGEIPSKLVLCKKANINIKHVYNINQSKINFSKDSNNSSVVSYTFNKKELSKLSDININQILKDKDINKPFFFSI